MSSRGASPLSGAPTASRKSPEERLPGSPSDQALHKMRNELNPLRLPPELRSQSPSTSTRLRQGGASPVVCEQKVSELDFRDIRRVELLRPSRRASDDSGLRTLGPGVGSSTSSPLSVSPTDSPNAHRVSCASNSSSSPHDTRMLREGVLSRSPVRRHSISSAATIVRYVEWTPEDSDSRRRGRLVVESERNIDFASRHAARRQTLGIQSSAKQMEWAARILRENFLFMHMSTTTLLQLLQCMEQLTLRAGQTLFNVGDCDDCLYLLVSGQMNTEPRAKVRVRVRARARVRVRARARVLGLP